VQARVEVRGFDGFSGRQIDLPLTHKSLENLKSAVGIVRRPNTGRVRRSRLDRLLAQGKLDELYFVEFTLRHFVSTVMILSDGKN